MKINLRREGVGLIREGGLINFLPLKRGAYLRGERIKRGFAVFGFYHGLFNCV